MNNKLHEIYFAVLDTQRARIIFILSYMSAPRFVHTEAASEQRVILATSYYMARTNADQRGSTLYAGFHPLQRSAHTANCINRAHTHFRRRFSSARRPRVLSEP